MEEEDKWMVDASLRPLLPCPFLGVCESLPRNLFCFSALCIATGLRDWLAVLFVNWVVAETDGLIVV